MEDRSYRRFSSTIACVYQYHDYCLNETLNAQDCCCEKLKKHKTSNQKIPQAAIWSHEY